MNDIMGGMFGAIGIIAALRERDRTGRGQQIQSALFENCAFLVAQHMQQFSMTGEPPPPMQERVSSWSVYDVFTVADGRQLFVGAVSDRHWELLCEVLAQPDLACDPALRTNAQRVAARATLIPRLAEVVRRLSFEDLAAKLEAAGLPYARILRPDELMHDPHLVQGGSLVPMQTDDGSTTPVVLLPLLLDGRRPGVRLPLARAGEHNDEVLGATADKTPGVSRQS